MTVIKKYLSKKNKRFIRKKFSGLIALINGKDLDFLARLFETDKFGAHFYTKHYQTHFENWRKKKINILEIGIGGYDDPHKGGESLRMWKHYFKKATIYGLDIYDKTSLAESRIKIFQGSQIDTQVLDKIVQDAGTLELIIDDGSHLNNHVIETFDYLFPLLAQNGIYVIEDVQTSYWPDYNGTSEEMNNPSTIMGYFKGLLDGINHAEFITKTPSPTYLDLNIIGMHFYHNMIFIQKGDNSEPSNFLVNNQVPLK